MPQFTIDLPETILPVLNRKAEGWQQTPEGFLSSYVKLCLENDEQPYADPAREALEDLLEERDKGPFVTITDMDAYRQEIRGIALKKLQQTQLHA